MDKRKTKTPAAPKSGSKSAPVSAPKPSAKDAAAKDKAAEIGGPKGPEPTRYGDWERGGICVDF